jgi:hypothetical protein
MCRRKKLSRVFSALGQMFVWKLVGLRYKREVQRGIFEPSQHVLSRKYLQIHFMLYGSDASRLMPFREFIVLYSENHTKQAEQRCVSRWYVSTGCSNIEV